MRAAVFEMYLEFRERIPAPSPAEERPVITLPLLLELKVRLWQTMIDQDISQADLTRRLGKDPQHVRCLIRTTAARSTSSKPLSPPSAAKSALRCSLRREINAALARLFMY